MDEVTKALQVARNMIRGEIIEGAVVDLTTMQSLGDFLDVALAAQSAAPADRELRTGAHLLQTARSLGWVDDGEGALEFMLRRTREVAIEDCRESVGEPVAWLCEYDGHTDATTDPDTVRIWAETLHRAITPLFRTPSGSPVGWGDDYPKDQS